MGRCTSAERRIRSDADFLLRPQAVVVKASNPVERVEAAAVRAAGSIAELIEFAKDGDGGGGAEGGRELIESGDPGAGEEAREGLRGEKDGPHNAMVPLRSTLTNRTIASSIPACDNRLVATGDYGRYR